MKGLFEQIHPGLKLISLVVLMLFCLAVTMVIGSVIAVPIVGVDGVLDGLQQISYTKESLPFLRYFQTLQGLGLFVLSGFTAAYLFNSKPLNYIGVNKTSRTLSMSWLLAGIILSIPLVNYIGFVNESMQFPESLGAVEEWMRGKEEVAKHLTELFVSTDSYVILLLNIVMIAAIPAVGEELIFRGIMQRIFKDWSHNIHVAVWAAAFVFSAMHLQFYGFIPRLLLGALLGYIYAYSGNIWYAIWVHFINNGFAVFLYFLAAKGIVVDDIDSLGTTNIWMPVCTGILGGIMFYQFFKEQKLLRMQS